MNNTDFINSARGNPSQSLGIAAVCCTILGAVTDKAMVFLSKLFAGLPLFISKEYLSIYAYNLGININ